MLKHIWREDVGEHSSSLQGRQPGRECHLHEFKKGGRRILVTSDALTRGVDIPGVDLVVNYDTPTYPKTYVHRAGRTARAGQEGLPFLRKFKKSCVLSHTAKVGCIVPDEHAISGISWIATCVLVQLRSDERQCSS